MAGILDTRLGTFAKAMANLSVSEIEAEGYNDSVLVQMADLNTKSQLDELGVFADGSPTPDYAYLTVQMKKAEGKRFDHMNFDDTGETRESITYIFDGMNLRVDWNDRFDLADNYGQIVGLTPQSIGYIQPEISQNIRQFILSKL